ncbi:peptidyl-prolyl cis-trans isomerase SurA [Mariniphaga anaerophila]|uniref:Peptidyl-prolyl cis-trans isomerase SurA n=1 Tax=Mariniphaga anaerophila TaxID=1484053 RepID=A0A1M4WEH5_9BACT|nr:peptidylprolyl isomerase [Mariniphaga anaerophila]SHE79585.1 peptidyl-prolyl cis-trans isomerase SurA [Mariniphaga anaerophila]
MKGIFLSLVFATTFSFFNLAEAQKKEVLIKIGNTEITKQEFERIYRKNNQNLLDQADVKSPKDYLDLYVNFKLKVVEAMDLKMDTISSFREELAGYRKELAAPYLTDMQYDEQLIEELHRRMQKEVDASHILFRLPEDATPEQEQAARNKALNVREEILNGRNFGNAAIEYSEDPSAKSNKGHLGYFTAFQMVTPFENAAFTTPVGEISEPVRSAFGYHLIQVHDVRKNKGEIQVAHIMKMFPQEETGFDKTQMKSEIDSIYRALLNGADFAEMAQNHSDDKRSAAQGGKMAWFSAGRMIPEFATPAFALKNIGDISEPIVTDYGFHIIKKLGEKPVPSLEEVRADIEARIKRDPERSNSTRKVFIDKLKKEYGFEENIDNLQKIQSAKIGKDQPENLLLFSFAGKDFLTEDFTRYLQNKNITTGNYSNHFNEWTDAEIIAFEDSQLEKKYPDFNYLMQEYHDGLLLFNIMDEKVWSFATQDSTGLEAFYNKSKGEFKWGERFKGLVISCKNEAARQEAENYFEANMPPTEIEDLINKEEQLIRIESGAWEKGTNSTVDYYVWNGTKPAGFNPELTFVRGDVFPPEPKTLDEARGLYISEYQNYLEQNWIKALRKKYKIKVNKKLLKSIPNV